MIHIIMYFTLIILLAYSIGYLIYIINKIIKSLAQNKVYNSYVRIIREPLESNIDLFYLEYREEINDEWKMLPKSSSTKYGEIIDKKEDFIKYMKTKDSIDIQNKPKWILQKLKTILISM